MTQPADDSLVLEQIQREFAQRAASDARLEALLGSLYGAFRIATEAARETANG